jgi:hypothetical protein
VAAAPGREQGEATQAITLVSRGVLAAPELSLSQAADAVHPGAGLTLTVSNMAAYDGIDGLELATALLDDGDVILDGTPDGSGGFAFDIAGLSYGDYTLRLTAEAPEYEAGEATQAITLASRGALDAPAYALNQNAEKGALDSELVITINDVRDGVSYSARLGKEEWQ